jgi:predicted permease
VAPGFETEQRLTFRMGLSGSYGPERRVGFFRELEERLTALPGVWSVGLTTGIPAAVEGASTRFEPEDGPLAGGEHPGAVYRVINPGYHQTMGIELISGRFLSRNDGLGGTPSVVINQVLAETVWPGENAIGKRLQLGSWERPTVTVVGIVESVRMFGLNRDPPPVLYWVHELQPWRPLFSVVIHAAVEPSSLVGAMRQAVRELDPHQPVFAINTVDGILSSSVASQRNSMTLLGLLSGIGLVMALVGVYGLLSFVVNHRQREIGIRMALGADTGKVRRLVVREGMVQVLAGLALGLAGAVGLGRFIRSLLFGISPTDATTMIGVSLLIVATALVATYLPARRATRVDPMMVMRAE